MSETTQQVLEKAGPELARLTDEGQGLAAEVQAQLDANHEAALAERKKKAPNARLLKQMARAEKEYQLRMSAARNIEKGIPLSIDEKRALRRVMGPERYAKYQAAKDKELAVAEQRRKRDRDKERVSKMNRFSINGQVYFAMTRKAAEKQAGKKNVDADRQRQAKGGWRSPMKKKS